VAVLTFDAFTLLLQSPASAMMGWFTSSTTKGQLQLLEALYTEAQSANDVISLLETRPQCLSDVLELLSCSNAAVQASAAQVLVRFAQPKPYIASQVLQCDGAMQGLASLLHSRAAPLQLAAATALRHLAVGLRHLAFGIYDHDDCIVIVTESGAIEGLVALLSSNNARVQAAAAGALAELASWDQDYLRGWALCGKVKEHIRQEHGVFTHLVALLCSKNVDVQREAAWALATLALDSPGISMCIAQEPSSRAALEAMLCNSAADVRFAGAFAIVAAAESSQRHRDIIEAHSSDVWRALHQAVLNQEPDYRSGHGVVLPSLLKSLAGQIDDSPSLRRSMVGSKEFMQLLQAFDYDSRCIYTEDIIQLLTEGEACMCLNMATCHSKHLGQAYCC
jgi:hypothetical protein